MLNVSTDEVNKRVAQELKNNADFIYQTNQSLQNLWFAIDNIKKEIHFTTCETQRVYQLCRIADERMETKFNEFKKEVKEKLDSFSNEVDKAINYSKCSENNSNDFLDKVKELEAGYKCNVNHLCDLEYRYTRISGYADSQDNALRNECKTMIEKLQKSLEDKPDELFEYQLEVSEDIRDINIDISGLKEEISALKYDMFVLEKHIEQCELDVKKQVKLV